jgi:hypothetical protein
LPGLKPGEQFFLGNDRRGRRGWRQGPAACRPEEDRQKQAEKVSEVQWIGPFNKIST